MHAKTLKSGWIQPIVKTIGQTIAGSKHRDCVVKWIQIQWGLTWTRDGFTRLLDRINAIGSISLRPKGNKGNMLNNSVLHGELQGMTL